MMKMRVMRKKEREVEEYNKQDGEVKGEEDIDGIGDKDKDEDGEEATERGLE